MVNAAMKINDITVRDANMPSNVEEFAEEFVDIVVASLIDFFFEYNQLDFATRSCDLIKFIISLELLRTTQLLQEVTNSIAQFVRIVTRILKNLFIKCVSFVDDIDIKRFKIIYNNKEIASSIRLYILEHI